MFAARRSRFLEALGPDAVALVIGARVASRSNDTEYPFRQDSDFWYLTGFGHPDAVAIFRTDGAPSYTLFVQPRDKAAQTWTGFRPGVEGAVEEYGADEAHEIGKLIESLTDTLRGAARVYHTLGRRPEIDQKLVEIQEGLRMQSRQGVAPASELVDPRLVLHEMRLVKEPAELDIMRRAAAITHEAHGEAARLLAPGLHEYEIEAVLDYTYRRRGSAGAAYGSIVAGGANATTLHYVVNDQPLRDGELVLIDSGAELEGYASDVTRTYPVSGRFEGPGKAVYEAVLHAQQTALDAVCPGATLPDLHDATLRCLVEAMLGMGLLSGEIDELIESEAYKRYYMHGTSHWLGLDVHDAGPYAEGKTPRPLEPGMVFTVEPGLYIAADDEEAPEAFRGIGVRIEDDVVITESGSENLTSAIPKQPSEVEAWVRAESS